jgi:formylglycine-generating enzyme required for sulfatase activity
VTGGTYDRTYANSGSGPTGEADPASVSSFRLDKYEVTVGRFRQFVTAWDGGAGYTPPPGSGKHTYLNGGQGLANSGTAGTYETGWIGSDDSYIAPTTSNLNCDVSLGDATWTNTAGRQENLPINCENWYEAYAFCIWDGGFLPSETEWDYAAAGGSQQREYPWGSTDPGIESQYAIYDCNYPPGANSTSACMGVTNIAPVGTATLGAGLWGQLDLAGNMWEWTLDWNAPYVNPCSDCAYLSQGSSGRVVRGGDYLDAASLIVSPSSPGSDPPAQRSGSSGFRCARTP